MAKLSIVPVKTAIALTPDELKKAGELNFNPKGVDLGFTKYELGESFAQEVNEKLNALLKDELSKLQGLKTRVDSDNGEGYFDLLQSQHEIKIAIWGAKTQGGVAREMATMMGKVPASLFEKVAKTAVKKVTGDALEIDID